MEHVWNAFAALTATRSCNGFALNPISYAEIAAWNSICDAMLTPWEVSLVRQIDVVVLSVLNNKREQQEPENVVQASDATGVKGLMGLLRMKANAVYGRPPSEPQAK